MAKIVETLLDTTSAENNRQAVYDWLNSYYSTYFDSVDRDNDGRLNFKINGVNKLAIFSGEYFSQITISNATTDFTFEDMLIFNKAFKTDFGICLLCQTYANYAVFITKDSTGDTLCAVYGTTSGSYRPNFGFTSSTSERILYTDKSVKAPRSIYRWTQKYGSNEYLDFITQKTILEPLMTYEGAYTPNLFLTPYSQYTGTVGIITIDGTDYVYNGYCALKG